MPHKALQMTEALQDYLLEVSLREDPVLAALRSETAALPSAGMQIAPEQGQFMALLIRLIGAKRVLEVGTFTGYSSLAMALALPDDGQVYACDVSEEFTSIARRYWAKAAVEQKITLTLAPALETLDGFLADGMAGTVDLMFIDADKESYDAYYERGLDLVRSGGLILVDNVLWNGAVIDPDKQDADTKAIRALNTKLKDDSRITLSMVPLSDGLTLALKNPR